VESTLELPAPWILDTTSDRKPHGFSGTIPPLAPGESYQIKQYVEPSQAGFDDALVLMLWPDDADSSNDIAVDAP
jgi:hypothetical protein